MRVGPDRIVRMAAAAALAILVGAGCQYHPAPISGTQRCAPVGAAKRCPDGYICASDDTCRKIGEKIPDMLPDGGPRTETGADVGGTSDAGDGPAEQPFQPHDALPAPSGHSLVPGGNTATSATYKIVKTTAQSPGGNGVRSSASYKMVGGLVGATQRSQP